jgi:predicted MFS family arabinose efflux permease
LWGSKYLVRVFQIKQGDVGHFLAVPPVCLDLGAIAFGDFASRFRRKNGEAPMLLYAVAMLMCSAIALWPVADTAWQAMAIASVTLAGGGALYTLATSDLLSRMPPDSVASAGGIVACAQSLSLVISSPLVGYAVDHSHSYSSSAITIGLWVIPGSLFWMIWRPRS